MASNEYSAHALTIQINQYALFTILKLKNQMLTVTAVASWINQSSPRPAMHLSEPSTSLFDEHVVYKDFKNLESIFKK